MKTLFCIWRFELNEIDMHVFPLFVVCDPLLCRPVCADPFVLNYWSEPTALLFILLLTCPVSF